MRALAALLFLPQALPAQQELVMRSETIGPGFVVISGYTNGNILARIGSEGTVLADAQSATRVGQTQASFTEAETGADAITFTNQAHDFPTRVTYRRAGPAGVHASVAGPGQGGERVIEFPYDATRCPAE